MTFGFVLAEITGVELFDTLGWQAAQSFLACTAKA